MVEVDDAEGKGALWSRGLEEWRAREEMEEAEEAEERVVRRRRGW